MTGNLAGTGVPATYPTPQPPLIPVTAEQSAIAAGVIVEQRRGGVPATGISAPASPVTARPVPKPGPSAQKQENWVRVDSDRPSADRTRKLTQIRTRVESVVHLLRSADYLGFHRLDADALDVAAVAADVAEKATKELRALIPDDDFDD